MNCALNCKARTDAPERPLKRLHEEANAKAVYKEKKEKKQKNKKGKAAAAAVNARESQCRVCRCITAASPQQPLTHAKPLPPWMNCALNCKARTDAPDRPFKRRHEEANAKAVYKEKREKKQKRIKGIAPPPPVNARARGKGGSGQLIGTAFTAAANGRGGRNYRLNREPPDNQQVAKKLPQKGHLFKRILAGRCKKQ